MTFAFEPLFEQFDMCRTAHAIGSFDDDEFTLQPPTRAHFLQSAAPQGELLPQPAAS